MHPRTLAKASALDSPMGTALLVWTSEILRGTFLRIGNDHSDSEQKSGNFLFAAELTFGF